MTLHKNRTFMRVVVRDRPRLGATPTDQHRAVSTTFVVLLVLVLVFAFRAALADDAVEVPAVPAGADVEEIVVALRGVDLAAVREPAPSTSVAVGEVMALEPAPGSVVSAGSTVKVLVSTGPTGAGRRGEDGR